MTLATHPVEATTSHPNSQNATSSVCWAGNATCNADTVLHLEDPLVDVALVQRLQLRCLTPVIFGWLG